MANNTLEHLLQIEAQAAALVNDAQKEADRRVRENEEKNEQTHNELLKAEIQKQELSLEEEKTKAKNLYQKKLNDYREEISRVNAGNRLFCDLLNEYIARG